MEDKRNSVKLKRNEVNETHAEGGGDSKRGRLRKPVVIHEHQFAFILRESTADAIFILYDKLLEATRNGYSFFCGSDESTTWW